MPHDHFIFLSCGGFLDPPHLPQILFLCAYYGCLRYVLLFCLHYLLAHREVHNRNVKPSLGSLNPIKPVVCHV